MPAAKASTRVVGQRTPKLYTSEKTNAATPPIHATFASVSGLPAHGTCPGQ
jgi:hypothetical protein